MIKLSDFVADFLAKAGLKHVFMLTGGGAMHLNDSFGRHQAFSVVFNHHEQASAMAAEAYGRLTNLPAIVNVTTGPGGINTLNGVFGAWTDSIPMIVISGQVRFDTTIDGCGLPALRQIGDQECDIIRMVKGISKYAVMVTDPLSIQYHLQKALYLATHGRPGPVWLDIPMNVQGAMIDASRLTSFQNDEDSTAIPTISAETLALIISKIQQAERPVIMVGTGVRLSKAHSLFLELLDYLKVPVVTAFNAHDVLSENHPLYVGRPGTVGNRAGNFAVQNADVLLILGCRLNIRQISYNWSAFARAAFKIMIDIDALELQKPTLNIDLPIHGDLADFFKQALPHVQSVGVIEKPDWLAWCKIRQAKYPVVLPEYYQNTTIVNPYCFIDQLSNALPEQVLIVTANATACICAFQALRIKTGQRLLTNSGSASMGYGLPAAIGACFGADRALTICLEGDGSLMMNLQELATVVHYQLPLKIFLLNNQGYHSIRQTQKNFFGEPLIGVDHNSGLNFPDFKQIAAAFGLCYLACATHADLDRVLTQVLATDEPVLCELSIDPGQAFAPKLSSMRLADGRMVSKPLEDLAPFLSRVELADNMLIPLLED